MSKHYNNYNKQYSPNNKSEEKQEKEFYEVSSTSPLNFRAFPKLDSEIRDMLKPGTVIEMIQDLGEWCEVKHDSQVGFVMKEFIEKV